MRYACETRKITREKSRMVHTEMMIGNLEGGDTSTLI